MGIIGYADAARFCNAFEASSNVDTVAEDVVFIENDVTDMDADPEFDPLILRHRCILLANPALDFNGTTHRIHGTRKLDQHAVPSGLDDPPAMLGDGGIDEGLPDGFEAGQRAFLVDAH